MLQADRVVTHPPCLIPGYTNPRSSALLLSQAFLLYFMLPVFLTPFLEGRSFGWFARPSLIKTTSLRVGLCPFFAFPYFLLDQKVTKSQGCVKKAKNRQDFTRRNNVVNSCSLLTVVYEYSCVFACLRRRYFFA